MVTKKTTKSGKRMVTRRDESSKKRTPARHVEHRERTLAEEIRELVSKGLDNAEVFRALEKRHGEKAMEGKRAFPAWYRRDAVKRGLVDEDVAYPDR